MKYAWLVIALCGGVLAEQPRAAKTRAFECLEGREIAESEQGRLVSKVQETYQSVRALTGKFVQDSYLASLDTSENSAGEVAFKKPGMMRWQYKYPEKQLFVVKDETLWFYQPNERQVTIDSLKKVLLSDLPVGFLIGIGDLTKEFEVRAACEASVGIVIDFVPKRRSSDQGEQQLAGFSLMVERGSLLPKGSEVIDVAGNVTSIVIEELVRDGELNAEMFLPTFPRGTDITDRRNG